MEWGETLQNSLLVITNVAILPAVYRAACRGLLLEFYVFLNLFWASSTYHLCDAFHYCLLDPHTHKWLDFMFAFSSAVVIVVYYMNFHRREHKYVLFLWLALATVLAYSLWGFTLTALGILIALLCVCTLIRWYHGGMAHFDLHELLLMCVLVGVGLVIFVFFNRNHDDYWIVHSVWHVVIMLSALIGLYVKVPPAPHPSHPACAACTQSGNDWIIPTVMVPGTTAPPPTLYHPSPHPSRRSDGRSISSHHAVYASNIQV